ncbi:MAG: DNA replication/repair protein RecF [Candidatus Melainabacteria bacterium]|nr:DNA replication/repair protein RecF [Candidatus Melainabacteria bacterium]
MWVQQVKLTNYRNYRQVTVRLDRRKTILIGHNAQGKSNFLEAIELACLGKSVRSSHDEQLVLWGEDALTIEVAFQRLGTQQTIVLMFSQSPGLGKALHKQIKINDVCQGSTRALLGQLVTVSFKSQDLNLLRAGPSVRRLWIDSIIHRLKPAYQGLLANYQKVVLQRNRLLKEMFSRHRVSVSDQEELMVWDKQLARFGSQIVKQRVLGLLELLPVAKDKQSHLSAGQENLAVSYALKALVSEADDALAGEDPDSPGLSECMPLEMLSKMSDFEIASILLKALKQRRSEEIGRKQTLVGPHRDDVMFCLNDASAQDFASQGQQRSLVLALKLAELEAISKTLNDSPVLLLDDVLAELDVLRQGLLMSAITHDMQTVITTTHLSKFEPEWLNGAYLLEVSQGEIQPAQGMPCQEYQGVECR